MQNQAQLKNAEIDLQRYKGLYAEDSIAKQTWIPRMPRSASCRAPSVPTRARSTTPAST